MTERPYLNYPDGKKTDNTHYNLSPTGKIRFIISYVINRKLLIGKFILVSGSAVLLNLLFLFLLVNNMGMNSKVGENIANILSMECSVIYNFIMSRSITWSDRYKEHGWKLIIQFCKFHVSIGITILLRMGLFAFLQWLGVFYLLNAAIGIAISACFNFVVYDSLVFKRRV